MLLFHVTDRSNLESIKKYGLKAGSYFSAWEEMTSYYAETVEDEEGDPVVLAVHLNNLIKSNLSPDLNGVVEPIMTVVRRKTGIRTEDDLHDEWESTEKDWNASLDIIGCIRYDLPIEPGLLMACDPMDYSKAFPLMPRQPNKRVSSYEDQGMNPK